MFLSVPSDNVDVAPAWERPPDEWLTRLADVPAAIAGDLLGRMTVIAGDIRLLTEHTRLLGFALPVRVRPGDNLAIHRALDEARPGDVLVVSGRGDTSRAVIGDLIGEIMLATGVRGAVIDGAIRDVEALGEQGLAIYARTVTPAGPYKSGPGTVGFPVAIGDVVVTAGDVLIGDADGVTVVPVAKLDHVCTKYRDVLADEAHLRARIRETASRGTSDDDL